MKWEEIEKPNALESVALIDSLHHSDEGVRCFAALELGKRKNSDAVDELVTLLLGDSNYWRSGQAAATALAEIGDNRAIEPLIAALNNAFVSGSAVEALAKMRDEKALDPLIKLFEKTSNPSLATVLGNWGDTRAVEPLINAMSHAHPHVRFYAARALGKLGDERAIPVLQWAQENDVEPITDTKSLRGKSVSYVAGKAIRSIKAIK